MDLVLEISSKNLDCDIDASIQYSKRDYKSHTAGLPEAFAFYSFKIRQVPALNFQRQHYLVGNTFWYTPSITPAAQPRSPSFQRQPLVASSSWNCYQYEGETQSWWNRPAAVARRKAPHVLVIKAFLSNIVTHRSRRFLGRLSGCTRCACLISRSSLDHASCQPAHSDHLKSEHSACEQIGSSCAWKQRNGALAFAFIAVSRIYLPNF